MITPKTDRARRSPEPPESMKLVVDGRDQQKCVRCGAWLADRGSRHHRQRRAVGGHLVVNLILLCGSGTTGCHGWAHSNVKDARREGLIVRTSVVDIAAVPVRILDTNVSLHPIYVRLTPDGQRIRIADEDAIAELEMVA